MVLVFKNDFIVLLVKTRKDLRDRSVSTLVVN